MTSTNRSTSEPTGTEPEYPTIGGTDGMRPSTAVTIALAEVIGTAPESLDPLFETLDPDALDALVDSDGLETLRFVHAGHEITIDGDGCVGVRSV